MRVLVVNWQDRENPHAGGAEIHLHEIFGRLRRRGHEVTLLCSGWEGAPARAEVGGLDVVRAGRRYTFPLHARRAFRERLAGGRGFDLIVEDVNKVPLFTPVWSALPVVLLVPHLFGATAFRQERAPVAAAVWLSERLMPAAYRTAPVLAISAGTADDLVARGFRRERITVSRPGIDHRFYRPDPAVGRFAEPTLVYAGRLQRYKNLDVVLRALSALAARGRRVRLVAVGRGGDGPRLAALAGRLGIRDFVDFPGYVSEEEKLHLLRRAWGSVYPSPKEGWGIGNVEAAACGTPALAADAPGLRESVADGRSGFLLPVRDAAAWAEKIERLCVDPVLRRRLSEGAIAHAARFTWEKTTDETEAVLAAVS
ncbi:MAG: glycosyltransferase family 4 protein [Gemmatimonadota bacterium]|nr:glycosyltransferase family 4 protein [Gemmatimonadota bacterium]